MNQLAGGRILIIDDHADLVENLREILEDEGAKIQAASSAADGLRLATEPYEVALVDVRLPDARGPALLPRLKSGDGLQEVILVTGHASIQDAADAVHHGAFAYVLKPFAPADLVGTVGRAIERVRLRRTAATLQSALARSENALRTLVDTVQALLLVLDHEARITQANQAVVVATGTGLHALLGTPIVDHVVVHHQAAMLEACSRLLSGEASASLETGLPHREANGRLTERTVSWRLTPVVVEGEVRIYASGLDVTDVRELERRTWLAEKLAAVGTVSAGLAHEIRNPLNAARLQLQLLERRIAKRNADPQLVEPIMTVQAEITRLSDLVTDFLSFARPQHIHPCELELVGVVRQAAELHRPEALARNVELHVAAETPELYIEADESRLKQVLLNLIANGLDAASTPRLPPGVVEVKVERWGAGARLVVRDNGPGVPSELQARIFEPFFTTKDHGTGLGTAIAHTIVEMHGGSITVGEAGGAVFTVTLPRNPPYL